jgi:hypothetical protein
MHRLPVAVATHGFLIVLSSLYSCLGSLEAGRLQDSFSILEGGGLAQSSQGGDLHSMLLRLAAAIMRG